MGFFKTMRDLEKLGLVKVEINGVDKGKIDFASEKLDKGGRTIRLRYRNEHEIIDSVPKKYNKNK
ncbi:MAG: hypothetical protein SPD90_14465 [Intestinibacter sp.]|uniref:hypothetical protein n=1 Tax=Intestinibacter sp. TaxID=1965304 RepID=UPI002A81523C|nr:hypothetical protein [Intestinibacter sp.]MDY4576251.1 hypothetical protein [Intestinibacter sp.]